MVNVPAQERVKEPEPNAGIEQASAGHTQSSPAGVLFFKDFNNSLAL